MIFALYPLSHYEANLPIKANNDELLRFIQGLVIPPLPTFFEPQLYLFSIWYTILIFAGIYILIRKIRRRSFWIFRLKKDGNGTLLVVEPSISFLLLEGSFVIVYLVKNWLQISMMKHSYTLPAFGYITLLDALPLLGGGWAALFGIIYLFPQISFGKKAWRISRNPLLCNVVFIFVPSIILSLTLVSMGFQGNFRRDATLNWRRWKAELESQDPSALPTEEQIQTASMIWQRLARSYHVWAVSWFFWSLIGWVFSGLVAFVNYSLGSTLKLQLELYSDVDSIGEAMGADTTKASVINGNSRSKTLERTLRLMHCLTISLFIGSLGFASMALYHSLTLYEAFSSSPWEGGYNLSTEAVWSGWVGCTIGTPLFFLLTSRLFEETIGNWNSDKNVRPDPKSFHMKPRRSKNSENGQPPAYPSREELSTRGLRLCLDLKDGDMVVGEKLGQRSNFLKPSYESLNADQKEGSFLESKGEHSRETSEIRWEGKEGREDAAVRETR